MAIFRRLPGITEYPLRSLYGGRMRHLTCGCVGLFLLLQHLPASAQVIEGHVIDEERSPVHAALVSLLSESEEVLRSVEVGEDGNFRLQAPGPGSYRLRAERLGYQTLTTPSVHLESGSTIPVELVLQVEAIPMDSLVVEQRPRSRLFDPMIRAFYERKAEGVGEFIDREEIENRKVSRISELLRGMPGVITLAGRGLGVGVRFRGALLSRIPNGGRGDCRPAIWLDGMLVRPGGDRVAGGQMLLDDVASPHQVEGIEIYRHLPDIPIRYNTDSAMCGVILIWTR